MIRQREGAISCTALSPRKRGRPQSSRRPRRLSKTMVCSPFSRRCPPHFEEFARERRLFCVSPGTPAACRSGRPWAWGATRSDREVPVGCTSPARRYSGSPGWELPTRAPRMRRRTVRETTADIPSVVPRIFFLLVAAVVFFVYDNQAQIPHRRKYSRPGSYHHGRRAGPDAGATVPIVPHR